jgi:crotonobetainyl-CoA:carnitine CoA-transferase CaiB-like acyl-CoA transferase
MTTGRIERDMTFSPAPPLHALRVLDLTADIGSLGTRLLAGLGAEVIRVEPPGGHADRRRPPFAGDLPDPERGLVWFQFNAGKLGITLNLECEDGRALFRRLVAVSDVLIESQPVGLLASLGLDYAELHRIRPDLIQLSLSAFGQEGPYSGFAGSDLVEFAMGGLMYLCGDLDRPPVRVGAEQAYAQAGIQSAVATLVAVWRRVQTGEGSLIDFSTQEAMLWTLGNNRLTFNGTGSISKRAGGGRADLSGGNRIIYPCADGYIGFLRRSEGHIALHHWLDDEGVETGMIVADLQGRPLYGDGAPPAELRLKLEQVLQSFFATRTKRELVREGQRRNLIIAEVASPADLLASDHLRERRFFENIEVPQFGGRIEAPGAPYISEVMPWRSGRPPLLGEHNIPTYETLLGLSRSEVITLRAVNAI